MIGSNAPPASRRSGLFLHQAARIAAFSTIGLAALSWRLAGIASRGLWFWDEGIFLMSGRFVQWRLTHLGIVHELPPSHYPGFPAFLGKPGFIALLALVGSVSGGISQYSGIVLSILFSLLSLVIVHHWGNLLYRHGGWWAAGCLSFSAYYLSYSRSGLHEITADCLLLLGLFVIAPTEISVAMRRRLPSHFRFGLAGLVLGFALSCSYRLMIFLPLPIIAWLLFNLYEERKLTAKIIFAGLSYTAGMSIPIALTEAWYRVIIGSAFNTLEYNSYFQFLQAKLTNEGSWDAKALWFYPAMVAKLDGYALTALMAVGILLLLRRRSFAHHYVLLLILLPGLAFSASSVRVTRAVSALLPLAALAAGVFLAWLWQRLCGRFRVIPVLVTAVSLTSATIACRQITRARSGYADAFAYLEGQKQGHFSTMMPLSSFFMGKETGYYPPPSADELHQAARKLGFRYLLVDWQKYLWYHDSIRQIEEQFLPLKAFPNPYVAFTGVLNENYLPDDSRILPTKDRTIAMIKIYDLWQIFPDLKEGE